MRRSVPGRGRRPRAQAVPAPARAGPALRATYGAAVDVPLTQTPPTRRSRMRRRRRRPARARHSARSRRGRRRWSPGGGRRRAWTSSWYAGASWARMRSSRTRCNRTRYATRAGAPVEKTSFFRVMRFITRVTRETIVRRTFFCRPPFQHGGTETVLGKKRNKWRQSLRRARPEKRLRCTGMRPHCEAHTSQASSAEPGTSLARSSHAPCFDSCVVRASNATALAFRAPDPDAALL